MCSFSNILTSLHYLNLSFPLLFHVISTAIAKFLPWFPASSPRFQSQILRKYYFSWRTSTLLWYYCIILGTKSFFTSSETSSVISPKNIYLKVPKIYNLWIMSKLLRVDEVLLKVCIKGKHNLPEIINFFVICANL